MVLMLMRECTQYKKTKNMNAAIIGRGKRKLFNRENNENHDYNNCYSYNYFHCPIRVVKFIVIIEIVMVK